MAASVSPQRCLSRRPARHIDFRPVRPFILDRQQLQARSNVSGPITALTQAQSRSGHQVPIALGLVVLALRGVSYWALVVTVVVGLIGYRMTVGERTKVSAAHWALFTSLGVIVFAVVGLLSAQLPFSVTAWGLVATVGAAIAEEAFFRRMLFSHVAVHGPAVAIIVTALLFALVHLHAYGPRPIAINLAAGMLFGWQRWASGSWTSPAATHVAANLLAVIR